MISLGQKFKSFGDQSWKKEISDSGIIVQAVQWAWTLDNWKEAAD